LANNKWKKENPEVIKVLNRKYVNELAECYIKSRLISIGINKTIIELNPELIEVKKISILIKRINKKFNNQKQEPC